MDGLCIASLCINTACSSAEYNIDSLRTIRIKQVLLVLRVSEIMQLCVECIDQHQVASAKPIEAMQIITVKTHDHSI